MTADTTQIPLLRVNQLSKNFGGISALTDVSFELHNKEILGLIGPNGAGKTTLFNVMTGLYQPSKGDIFLYERTITGLKPYQVSNAGLARTFQNIRLFASMTAHENVMVGFHAKTHSGIFGAIFRPRRTKAEEASITERAHALLKFVGLEHRASCPANELPYGDQRRLEIARALATTPTLLALDEPAAGMNASETQSLKKLIEKIRENNIGVLLIEHDMKLIMDICDRILVLNYGQRIALAPPKDIQQNHAVIEAYLGGALS